MNNNAHYNGGTELGVVADIWCSFEKIAELLISDSLGERSQLM